MGKWLGLLATIGATWLASACDEGLGNCDPGVQLCDVQMQECQERVYGATACQRQQKAGPFPSIRSITSREFAQELAEEDGEPGPRTAWDVGLGLLGFIQPSSGTGQSTSEALVEGVLGFYDPRTGEVTLLSDATGLSRESKMLVLSHEFVHVLQDRDFDLRRFDRARSTDGFVANDSATEGEAVFQSNAVLNLGEGTIPEELDWQSYYDNMLQGVFESIDASASPFVQAVLNLSYPVGGELVTDAWLERGQDAINALYREDRMYSVADWQRPYPAGIDSPRQGLACEPPAGPQGYELFGEDVFGLAGVTALWSARGPGAEEGWERGRAWRGGQAWVYAKGDVELEPEGTVLVWQTRWDTAADAQAMAALYGETDDAFVRVEGRAAVIVATDDAATLDWAEPRAADWLSCESEAKTLPKGLDPVRKGRPSWREDPRQYVTRAMVEPLR